MRRLVVLLVILGGAGLVGDLGARNWAEAQVETRAGAELPAQVSTTAHIHAFPFLPALLLGGRVSEADGHFENVPAGPLTLAVVDVELHGVRINRHALFNDRRVVLKSISEGTISIEITEAELSRTIGVPITIASGEVHVTVAGQSVAARVTVQNNRLILTAAGFSQSLAIPRTRLVPCATSATVLAGRVRLACTIQNIPPALLGEANRQLSN